MSEDMIQQIAAVDGIAGYDATLIISMPCITSMITGEERGHNELH